MCETAFFCVHSNILYKMGKPKASWWYSNMSILKSAMKSIFTHQRGLGTTAGQCTQICSGWSGVETVCLRVLLFPHISIIPMKIHIHKSSLTQEYLSRWVSLNNTLKNTYQCKWWIWKWMLQKRCPYDVSSSGLVNVATNPEVPQKAENVTVHPDQWCYSHKLYLHLQVCHLHTSQSYSITVLECKFCYMKYNTLHFNHISVLGSECLSSLWLENRTGIE